jgi:hypothetical protein
MIRHPSSVSVAVIAAVLASAAAPARAHAPSDSYLTVTPAAGGGAVAVRWDIAVRDLDQALPLDADGDGAVTWGEVRRREPDITAHALSRLTIAAGDGQRCPGTPGPLATTQHADGRYLVLPVTFTCPPGTAGISLRYRFLFDTDPTHRAVVRVDDGSDRTLLLGPSSPPARIDLQAGAPPSWAELICQGVIHIWEGIDHLLFLIALLLPAVLRREGGRWVPVAEIRPALLDVTRIVTAFTAAHSLTLGLSSLGVVSLPARLVEPAIAASVALAAVNNVRPVLGADRWVVAFALGLLHGFGFSSVLAELGVARGAHLARALVGFNAGVELGQLAVVVAFVPAAYLLRRTAGYRRLALVGGSLAIAAVSVVWIVERIATTG